MVDCTQGCELICYKLHTSNTAAILFLKKYGAENRRIYGNEYKTDKDEHLGYA